MSEYYNQDDIDQSKYIAATPLNVIAKITVVVWALEFLIMYGFHAFEPLSEINETIVDATLISIFTAVCVWFWIIGPLKIFIDRYLSHLESLEKALNESAIVAVTDLKGKITYVNDEFVRVSGFAKEELIGQDHRIVNSGHHPKEFFLNLWKTISGGKTWKGEVKNRRKDGSYYWVDSTAVPMFNSDGHLSQYIAIRYDITSRKTLEENLIRAREDAERASRAKARFLANMSHEIRTPMNGIIGMSNLLLSSETDPVQIERLQIIQSCGAALLEVINDVLDFSKLEAEKVEIEMQAFSLHGMVKEVVDLLNTRASEKGLILAYHPSSDMPDWIVGDSSRLRQILMNLVGNAIKFTDKGRVDIFSKITDVGKNTVDNKLKFQFAIQDTGIGIPEDVRKKLFLSFSQVDASTTRKYGGSGLGLAISKGLCEKMGGTVEVESTIGEGSTFYFSFLAEKAEAQHSQNRTKLSFDGQMGQKFPLKILVAEDNRTNQLVVIGLLGKLGYEVEVVANGREAVLSFKKKDYDLILMDCHMPELDGFEATKEILAHQNESHFTKKIPRIVALTASTMQEDIIKCQSSGMTGFLGKPLVVTELIRVLQETYINSSKNNSRDKKVS